MPSDWTADNPTEEGCYWANLGWKEEMVEPVLVRYVCADSLQFTVFASDGRWRDLDEARAWCPMPLTPPDWVYFERRAGS